MYRQRAYLCTTMNKLMHHIVIIIAAIAVFFTGTGVTVMSYCCTGCITEVFADKQQSCCLSEEAMPIEESDCCTMHGDMAHNEICANTISSVDEHCTSSRLSIDLDSSMFRPHVASPFVWLSDVPVFSVNLLPKDIERVDVVQHVDDPPTIPPRSYLSLIRVLVI